MYNQYVALVAWQFFHSMYNLINLTTNRVVADKIVRGDTLWTKGIGLIGHRPLRQGEGLWLPGVGSVHTFGVRFSIDILFLDEQFRSLSTLTNVSSFRIASAPRGTKHCVELRAGSLSIDEVQAVRSQWKIGSL